jgi:lipopolysaccharide/colanic/teichoic acid biosynthesis glycosyltransferase
MKVENYTTGQPSITNLSQRPVALWSDEFAKRTMDATLSFVFLLLLAPFLLFLAILICLDSSGSPFFVQTRVGRGGRPFHIYKFRSMHKTVSKYDLSPTTSADFRITRLGRSLRKYSLDELPQLINVLRGDMSLVGPRPEMPFIVEHYNSQQRQRLQATPGITGLWQLSRDRALPIHQNIHHDLYYIQNRSLFMDLRILIRTVLFAMSEGI